MALLSLSAFYLVKIWRSAAEAKPASRDHRTRWWKSPAKVWAAGFLSLVGFRVAEYVKIGLTEHLGAPLNPNAAAHAGTFTEWLREIGAMIPAGLVEEPVFVGIVVLLWPCRKLSVTSLIGIAALTSLARTLIHLYYASGQHGTKQLALVGVIALWCAIWSTMNLLAVYLSKSLVPVIVVHGLVNLQVTSNGDWAISPLLSNLGRVCLATIFVVGGLCGALVLMQSLDRRSARREKQPPGASPVPEAPQTH